MVLVGMVPYGRPVLTDLQLAKKDLILFYVRPVTTYSRPTV